MNWFSVSKITELIKWSNDNDGFVSIILFIVTIFGGWISGIFEGLRRRPKFNINVIMEGPTMCCTFETGRKSDSHDTHRTAIALYLEIANVGSAPSDIKAIEIGYHNHTLKHTLLHFWLKHQTVALVDFHVPIGDKVKAYPFLIQGSSIVNREPETFLEVGKKIVGVVYFEQPESWGGFYPRDKEGKVSVKVKITDVFGGKHTVKAMIPKLSLDQARRFSPLFGSTLESLSTPNEPDGSVGTLKLNTK